MARGSAAAIDAQARYPQCTIQFVDEVAKGQPNPREYIVKTLIANQQVDALRDVDVRSRHLCETRGKDVQGGLAVADVYSSSGLPSPVLAMPLLTPDQAIAFEVALGEVDLAIKRNESKFDVPQFADWEVASWLKMPEKVNYPRWPEVLAVWCRTYDDLVSSRMKFNMLIDPEMLDAKIRYTYETNEDCPLPPLTKQAINANLIKLRTQASDMRREASNANTVALGVLDAVTPTAQAWGMLAFTGMDRHLYFNSGPAKIMDDTQHTAGPWDSNPYHKLAFVPPVGSGDKVVYEFKPRYHGLIIGSNNSYPGDPDWSYQSSHDWLIHLWVRADTFAADNVRTIRDAPQFTDVSAAQINGQRLDCWAGVLDGVQTGWLDAADQYNSAQYTPGPMMSSTKAPVDYVRVMYPITDSVLERDPDRDVLASGSAGLDRPVVYAGLRSSPEIHVNALNSDGYVPSPWTYYIGIAADRHYLWVFGSGGFACATHASVISCLQGKRQSPRWMTYYIPDKMYGRHPYFDSHGGFLGYQDGWDLRAHARGSSEYPTNFKGLISMSPCDDGTIFASAVYRDFIPVGDIWRADDTPRSYTTRFVVDVEAQSMQLDDWTQIGGSALQVHKLPIPCWRLFQSLKAKLELCAGV